MQRGEASRVRFATAVRRVNPELRLENRKARTLYIFSADFLGKRAKSNRYDANVCFLASVTNGPIVRVTSLPRATVVWIFSFMMRLCCNPFKNALRSPSFLPNFLQIL